MARKKKQAADETAEPTAPLTEAEKQRLDIEAIRRIARNAQVVEEIEGDLALTRRNWNELVAKARAGLKATIESSGGTDESEAKGKLDMILMAQQDFEEQEAGRKVALHDVLTRKKKARKALRESFDNARQLELGGVSSLPDESSEDLTEGHAPPIG